MLTVACVLRSGGVYTPEWVRRLRRGVEKHLPAPHRFLCLSDVPVDCDRMPIESDWPHWWPKLELFAIPGPVLYFDLDTIVVGDLTPLVSNPGFWMVGDYLRRGRSNSTAMFWSDDRRYILNAFRSRAEELMPKYDRRRDGRIGDQAFIEDMVPDRQHFPKKLVVSYKKHAREGVPSGAAAVAFHGKPKPNEIKHGWVAEAWNERG